MIEDDGMERKNKKVLVGMSGGVDSSVAALLLQKEGHEVGGATFRLFEDGGDAAAGAREICSVLGIPHYTLDFRAIFAEYVVSAFVSEYDRGATPNPCVQCNRYIKFPAFLQAARELGYSHIATGHYARLEHGGAAGRNRLRIAAQRDKDQSYVLYNLKPDELDALMLPLGEYGKDDIRAIARENNFASANKPDSQDICFIPDGDYAAFLHRHTGRTCQPGNLVDLSGNVLGRHRGIWHYTVGQRKGLGVSFGKPMFVAGIDGENNTVILAEDDALYTDTLEVTDINYLSGAAPREHFQAAVRIRYGHRGAAATVFPHPDGGARIVFEQPQRAITKGQSAVFYQGEYLLGGGIIL